MKNGPYILVKAPAEYPGKRYRERYVYEHHLIWWQNTGQLVPDGYTVHHKDEVKTNNAFSNLELKSRSKHNRDHAVLQFERSGRHGTWATGSRRCLCSECRRKRTAVTNQWRWRTGDRVQRKVA